MHPSGGQSVWFSPCRALRGRTRSRISGAIGDGVGGTFTGSGVLLTAQFPGVALDRPGPRRRPRRRETWIGVMRSHRHAMKTQPAPPARGGDGFSGPRTGTTAPNQRQSMTLRRRQRAPGSTRVADYTTDDAAARSFRDKPLWYRNQHTLPRGGRPGARGSARLVRARPVRGRGVRRPRARAAGPWSGGPPASCARGRSVVGRSAGPGADATAAARHRGRARRGRDRGGPSPGARRPPPQRSPRERSKVDVEGC
jgi:hypothetical protein